VPCLVAAIAFFFPRLAIVLLVIFSDYVGRAYATILWPLLGFLFMPYTTLTYAWAKNSNGSVDGFYLIAVIVAVLVDLGVIGGSGSSARKARRVKVKRLD
jgi:hypothetical protein